MLDRNNLYSFKNEKVILQGNRSRSSGGLWNILITRQNKSTLKGPTEAASTKQTPSPQSMNVILQKYKSAQDLEKYPHAACFPSTSKTLINSIKRNYFVSWPGLFADLIQKHLPQSISTLKGHLNQYKMDPNQSKH